MQDDYNFKPNYKNLYILYSFLFLFNAASNEAEKVKKEDADVYEDEENEEAEVKDEPENGK